ncbi:MAG: 1-acyl-sn-glycerol-3-phosphate acyltransferase [Nocardioidaceae bacterium]|nr:1-acyl-sn-glycerol-3-phosphate acyltransferase [Nocardioidaceae bacterium]
MTASPRDRTYRIANWLFARLFWALGIRFDVRGADNIPASGSAILAANHIGFLDFALVGYAARERKRFVRFMTKRSIFDVWIVGRLMRAMRHIPVTRTSGATAYRQARRSLDDGHIVGVFPEATISRSFELKPFRPGAAGLAISRKAPIVPVITWGGHRVWTVDGRRSLKRGTTVIISVGAPLWAREGDSIDDLTQRLMATMADLLTDVLDDYPGIPTDDEDTWWVPHSRGGSAPDAETAAGLDREALARIGESID